MRSYLVFLNPTVQDIKKYFFDLESMRSWEKCDLCFIIWTKDSTLLKHICYSSIRNSSKFGGGSCGDCGGGGGFGGDSGLGSSYSIGSICIT